MTVGSEVIVMVGVVVVAKAAVVVIAVVVAVVVVVCFLVVVIVNVAVVGKLVRWSMWSLLRARLELLVLKWSWGRSL